MPTRLDTIRSRAVGFALGESGRVEQQKALPFAWTAGLMVGAAAVVSAPGVAEADICNDRQFNVPWCVEEDCAIACWYWDQTCSSQCITEHVCDCY